MQQMSNIDNILEHWFVHWSMVVTYRPIKQYKQQKFNHFNWILCMNGFLSLPLKVARSNWIIPKHIRRWTISMQLHYNCEDEMRTSNVQRSNILLHCEKRMNIRADGGRRKSIFRFCHVHIERQCHYSCWMEYNWILSRILLCMAGEM